MNDPRAPRSEPPGTDAVDRTGPPHAPRGACPARDAPGGGEGDINIASPRLYTPAEAAMLLRVRESWLRRQAGERRIPSTFLGKHLRFSDTDLRAVIAAGTRTTGRRTRRR